MAEGGGWREEHLINKKGWGRMPKRSSEYGKVCSSYALHRTYISDAISVNKEQISEVNLSDYEIFYFVVPNSVGDNLRSSCAWHPDKGKIETSLEIMFFKSF